MLGDVGGERVHQPLVDVGAADQALDYLLFLRGYLLAFYLAGRLGSPATQKFYIVALYPQAVQPAVPLGDAAHRLLLYPDHAGEYHPVPGPGVVHQVLLYAYVDIVGYLPRGQVLGQLLQPQYLKVDEAALLGVHLQVAVLAVGVGAHGRHVDRHTLGLHDGGPVVVRTPVGQLPGQRLHLRGPDHHPRDAGYPADGLRVDLPEAAVQGEVGDAGPYRVLYALRVPREPGPQHPLYGPGERVQYPVRLLVEEPLYLGLLDQVVVVYHDELGALGHHPVNLVQILVVAFGILVPGQEHLYPVGEPVVGVLLCRLSPAHSASSSPRTAGTPGLLPQRMSSPLW